MHPGEAVLRVATTILSSKPAKIVTMVLLAPFALFWFGFMGITLFMFAPLLAAFLPTRKTDEAITAVDAADAGVDRAPQAGGLPIQST